MNFENTTQLLEALKPFTENADITVSTENKDWKNRAYRSDLVTIDQENNVGFEVFPNEIVVFFFTDHLHFEDYTCEPEKEQENYVERAKSFLLELFQYKIRHIEFYKGKTLLREKYYILYGDEREDTCIGNTSFGFLNSFNPFAKKTSRTTTRQYDKTKGRFTTRTPEYIDPDAIETIDINDRCYIMIFKKRNTYTYTVMKSYFDDYFGKYYWAPASDVVLSGRYDTKEKAIQEAKEALAQA